MHNYTLEPASVEESQRILDALIDFDLEAMPHLPRIDIKKLDFTVKDNHGKFMGGICAEYFWNILFIKFLCIEKDYRGKNLGGVLLNHIEALAKTNGCYMSHLDTFDFQGKDFYLKQGYKVFGVLDDCPPEHKRYFLAKKL